MNQRQLSNELYIVLLVPRKHYSNVKANFLKYGKKVGEIVKSLNLDGLGWAIGIIENSQSMYDTATTLPRALVTDDSGRVKVDLEGP